MHRHFLAIGSHQLVANVLKDLHYSCVDFQLTGFPEEEKHTRLSSCDFKCVELPTAAPETIDVLNTRKLLWVSFWNSVICTPTEPDKGKDLTANQEQRIRGSSG